MGTGAGSYGPVASSHFNRPDEPAAGGKHRTDDAKNSCKGVRIVVIVLTAS